jgi:hypothetical protein
MFWQHAAQSVGEEKQLVNLVVTGRRRKRQEQNFKFVNKMF